LNTPELLKYNKTDEWVKVEEETATIGITDYAQSQLSDVVFAQIQVSVGDMLAAGSVIATVESVKASSDVTTPISGKVLEINEEINSSPEILNADPYGQAWLIKIQIKQSHELNNLLDAAAYREFRKE